MIKELEFIRKKVIMACHPEGNDIDYFYAIGMFQRGYASSYRIEDNGELTYIDEDEGTWHSEEWKPITLAKVLIAISKIDSIYVEIDDYGHIWQTTATNVHSRKKVAEWDLTKDLDQQETKTILSISKLLGYEKEME